VAARNAKGQPTYGVDEADEQSFATDWLCDKAVAFIRQNRQKPFCYMVSLPDPHGPNTVRAPYDTMYEKVNVPIPVSLTRRPDQIPAWGKSAGVKPEQLRKLMRNYYGMVRCIDDNVGKILKMLREEGLIENTLIVFTADHGDLCGEHGRLNKGVPYEGSAKIPFLLYCPGKVKGGTIVSEALSNVDFLPTAMRLLDVSHDRKVDGRDASQLFLGKASDWEDITFVRSTGQPGKPGAVWISAITEDLKLVYSSIEEPWLIDRKSDPNELTNLFGEADHQAKVRWMTLKLGEYGKAHKDDYVKHPRIRSWMDQVQKSGG
jgi:arylsulfatase A-like enzyme